MMARVKTLPASHSGSLANFPNFHRSESIRGMKKLYYGPNALLVRCGQYIYNVSSEPSIYERAN